MVRFTPTTETVPPGGGAGHGVEDRWRPRPTASITRLGAPAAGRLEDLRRTGCDPGVDGLGPEALGAGQAFGHHVHGEDARRPEERRRTAAP